MKKLLLITVCFLALAGCKQEKTVPLELNQMQNDSLQKIIDQRDNEINDMMATLNQIQEGFRLITEAENRVSVVKDGEGSNKTEQIKNNIRFIQSRMQENRELIDKLRKQLRESTFKSEELKRTLDGLVKQLDDKDKELA
ncbi:MAG: hypothetical protein J5918_04540, partial [Prevotella sp.]|nr:hypothetical protein [Prevotella sp.]